MALPVLIPEAVNPSITAANRAESKANKRSSRGQRHWPLIRYNGSISNHVPIMFLSYNCLKELRKMCTSAARAKPGQETAARFYAHSWQRIAR